MAESLIQEAQEQFQHSEEGSLHNRKAALEDIGFARLAQQWPAEIERQRMLEGRPCLTVNRMPSFIRQVVNDARQNKPGISVRPVDGGADYDTAEVIGGLIRGIERRSNAGVAYDTAVEHQVTGGFGFFRVVTDYVHPESFDMEARIVRVPNPLSVHWDTDSLAFDASDWRYAFVDELLTDDDFKRRFPKAAAVSFEGTGSDDDLREWGGEDKIRIAEWWTRDEKKRRIVQLSDGRVMAVEDLKKPVEIAPGLVLPASEAMALSGLTPVREREATYYEVKRRLINGAEVLEEESWPGSMIPICPVWGEEVIFRGRRYFRSMIRDARDPQKMFNFWRSASTELVALAPRAPWIVEEGSIAPDEMAKWETANTRSHAYLTYQRGRNMPQRQPFAGVPAGAIQEALNSADDMKAVIGIYDAALGARSNETSGRAILARQRESDVSTFHFIDNLSRAIEYCGRVLVEIIPSLYGARQTIQILGPDEAPKVVRLQATQGEPPSAEDPDGKIYDINVGRYDVSVKTGPSYATQREETRETLMELIGRVPDAALWLGDVLVQNIDAPGMEEVTKRVRLMQGLQLAQVGLPPNVDQALAMIEQRAAQPPQMPMPGAPMGGPPQMPGGMPPA